MQILILTYLWVGSLILFIVPDRAIDKLGAIEPINFSLLGWLKAVGFGTFQLLVCIVTWPWTLKDLKS